VSVGLDPVASLQSGAWPCAFCPQIQNHASWPLRQSPKKVHEEMGSAANQRGGVGPMKAENKTRDGIGSFASPGGLRGCVF
jgi:hypothetical protein